MINEKNKANINISKLMKKKNIKTYSKNYLDENQIKAVELKNPKTRLYKKTNSDLIAGYIYMLGCSLIHLCILILMVTIL